MSGAEDPPNLAALLPHGERARFIDAVHDLAADSIVCLARVPPDSAYVVDGSFPTFVALELAAQSAALLEILERPTGDLSPPPPGYLVRVRDVRFDLARLPAGEPLSCRVRRTASAGRLRLFETEVSFGGDVVLRGTFSVLIDEPGQPARGA